MLFDITRAPETVRIRQDPIQRDGIEHPFTVEADGSEIPLGGAIEVQVLMMAGAETEEDVRHVIENMHAPRPLFEIENIEIGIKLILIVHEHGVDVADTTANVSFLGNEAESFRIAVRERTWDFFRNHGPWSDWQHYFRQDGEFFHIAAEEERKEPR